MYSFPLFTETFADVLLGEVAHYQASGLPVRRPNSMNNYGLILNSIGLEPLVDVLQAHYLQPVAAMLFPDDGGLSLDSHHTFMVRYKQGEDLGLDMHTDDSDVTFNVCLTRGFTGAVLAFCGHQGTPAHRHLALGYAHEFGRCVVHSGRKRHGAKDIASGIRENLIVWNRSVRFRDSRSYTHPPYVKEGSAPDAECLSWTHDRDYGKYLQYPAGKEHHAETAWCPPSHARHDGGGGDDRGMCR